MNLILQRTSMSLANNGSTIGVLFEKPENAILPFQHSFFTHTIEDEYRKDKVPGETRIPAGIYELKILKVENDWVKNHRLKYNVNGDNWFVYPIEITNVQGFAGILIHVGYGEKDTEGCILLDDTIGNNTTDVGYVGSRSMEAVRRFYKKVYPLLDSGSRAFLEVRDEIFLLK